MKDSQNGTIPRNLWSQSVIHLPPNLIRIYKDALLSRNLFVDACGPSPEESDIIGGDSDSATIKYFTHRFATSAVRLEYLVLNPIKQFDKIASDLLTSLTDGKITILDIPCGSGAGILSLLGTIAELRSQRCIVQLPVSICITGGDYSNNALEIYNSLLPELNVWVQQYGINISWNTHDWDATRPDSTAQLIDNWFNSASGEEEYLVLINAFSGAGNRDFDSIQRSIQHITERLYNKSCTIVWVEPSWGESQSLFKKLKKLFEKISWFPSLDKEPIGSKFKLSLIHI